MTFAQTVYMLCIGRIITGLGVGVSFVVVPIYVSEISPASTRGMLGALFDVSINVGILFGYIIGFIVADTFKELLDDTKWRLMFGIGGILPLIVLAFLNCLPESPRWLLAHNRHEEALTELAKFFGDVAAAEEAIQEITASASYEGEFLVEGPSMPDDITLKKGRSSKPLTWSQLFGFVPLEIEEQYLKSVFALVIGPLLFNFDAPKMCCWLQTKAHPFQVLVFGSK